MNDLVTKSYDVGALVTYLLSHNERSQVHSDSVALKTREAPLKCVTIPRMELIAATVVSRMDVS